jgi:NADPH:quinone reductase-like Zn-dependent oxidoreductase
VAHPARTITVCEVTAFGPPEVLKPAERPYPEPVEGEVVVRIDAATVNPSDIGGRSGEVVRRRMPDLKPPFVLGWDLAGEVADVGPEVDRWQIGDPVVGLIPWGRIDARVGAYAQAAVVQPEWLAPRPVELDAITAATVPLNALTASQDLNGLGLPARATLLITGASGAVGSYATQLAVAAGLSVVAIASDGDEAWVESLGAERVLPRSTNLETIDPVDALFDAVPIGAEATVAVKQHGSAVFTRRVDVPDRPDLQIETPLVHTDPLALKELTQKVAEGRLRTRVAQTIPLTEAAEAHRLVERGGLRGKIVLTTH